MNFFKQIRHIRQTQQVLMMAFFMVWVPSAFAQAELQTKTDTNPLQKIEMLIQQKLPNANVGVILQEAKTGKIIYERRANENFLPASATKLLPASAAFLKLGPHYQFETKALINPDNLKQGVLTGDLFIQFSGDPSFKTEDLQALIKEIKSSGVKEIQGDIVIDNTRFQGSNYALGWSWNSLPWGHSAPVTTIIINENKVNLSITPSKTLGEKANLTLAKEETTKLDITHDIISVSESEATDRCQIMVDINAQNEITAYGCWPAKESSNTLKVALKNPMLLARQIIADSLFAEDIKLTGQIAIGASTKDLKTIAVHQSKPLADLLKVVLQDSNNIYTDSITKTLGLQKFQQGTFQHGVLAIKDILAKELGLDTASLRLQDGSGLSRYTAVSPNHFARVLYGMYQHKQFNKIFRDSLSVSGEVGCLKNRMASFDLNGQVRAKTGSMLGTSSLAGYITTRNKQDLIFVMMVNNAPHEEPELKQFEDAMCELFASI